MKYSELLNKPVLSLSEGAVVGKVRGGLLNADKTRLLALDAGNGWALAKNVTFGPSAVLVKNAQDLSDAPPEDSTVCPVYFDLYDSEGSLAGPVTDLAFDEKLILTHFLTEEREVPRKLMLSAGENAVVFCADEETLRREKRKLSAPKRSEPAPAKKSAEPASRVSSDFGYLIGRKVEEDLFNRNNEKIVKRGTVVTAKILQICKENGKLLHLARAARTH